MKPINTHLITCLLLVSIPYITSISNFNFTFLGPQNDQYPKIVLQGDGGYFSDDGIHLTADRVDANKSEKAGRVTYLEPLHLWDNQSNEASFSTNFTFVIDSNGAVNYGYGFTFFLAQNNSMLEPKGSMGLPIPPSASTVRPRFVAVEFDTFWDSDWDPNDDNTPMGDHVGISVSSLHSEKPQKWFSNVTGGGVCEAWIRYDSGSKDFSVSYTGYPNNSVVRQEEFTHTIDLKKQLPEWVIFGFSAATGPEYFEKNILRSWSFNSSFLNTNPDQGGGKKSKVGLVVGLSVTVPFLVLLLFVF